MTIAVLGQSLRMTVNNVEVLRTVLPRPLEGTGVGLYAYDSAKVVFQKTDITEVKPSAFVIMPFSEPYDSLYRDVIKPIAVDVGLISIELMRSAAPG